MKDKFNFSKQDTLYFKGVAILMIVIHNYFHRYPGFKIENENIFMKNNLHKFYEHLLNFNFIEVFSAVFSYLGHYGVQVFIFFSAYGLSIQYARKLRTDKEFIIYRLKKIYFLLLFGALSCILVYLLLGHSISVKTLVIKFVLLSSTITGFSLRQMYNMFSGPFWFFALIIQLYILFPFIWKLVNHIKSKNIWILFMGSYLFIYFIYFADIGAEWVFFNNDFGGLTPWGNIIGHFPEVILGVYMAIYKKINFSIPVLILSGAVFIGSQLTIYLFPLGFLSMTILLIQLISFFNKKTKGLIKKILIYTGTVSMILFIVNGPLRVFSYTEVVHGLKIGFYRFPLFIIFLFVLSHILYFIYKQLTIRLKI